MRYFRFEKGLAIKTSELLRRGRITPGSLSMDRYRGFRGDPDNAGEVADWLEANPLFDADMPDPATAEVEIRPDQAKFRRAVGEAYGWTCAVTGCAIREVLDAAHVGPKGAWLAKNSARDGVLMRTDLHRLFDAGLARIVKAGPGDLKFEIAPDAAGDYGWADGKTLSLPKDKRLWPDL